MRRKKELRGRGILVKLVSAMLLLSIISVAIILTVALNEQKQFNRLAVDRELRMIELKRELNELYERLGEEPPYDLSFADDKRNIA